MTRLDCSHCFQITVEPIRTISVAAGVGYLTNSPSREKQFFPVIFGDGENIVGK